MSWDERIFGLFYKYFITSKASSREKMKCLKLESVRRQSEVFLSALCESKIEIRSSLGWGGFQGAILFLPEKMDFIIEIADQVRYLEWRILAASIDFQIPQLSRDEKGVQTVVDHFPQLQQTREILRSQLLEKGFEAWLGASPVSINRSSLINSEPQTLLKEAFSRGTEIKGNTKDRAQLAQIEEQKENPLTHVFEKVMTAEDYQGGHRKMDGSDEMAEHSEALSEINLSHVIRTQQSSNSIFKSNAIIEVGDADMDGDDAGLQDKVFYYPEWFVRKQSYLINWCTVYEGHIKEGPSPLPFDNKTAFDLKMRLESCFSSYQWVSRQKEGPEIDLTMAVDRVVQSYAGGALVDNIYLQKRRHSHDFAIQIVVDSSLSTDSYALGKRIIETTQEALNIFASAFCDIMDSISIAAFSSHTRNKIRFDLLKEFDEPWDNVASRISVLQPDGYTRIGPALRHARVRLEKVNARKKLVLLLSDAKPTDYDHYEGHHGVADIQRAVTELHAAGCVVKVLTLTDKKQSHHNAIFGSNNCLVLKDVKELSNGLFHFWYEAIR
jgi:nitric oxide reductase NorD protein